MNTKHTLEQAIPDVANEQKPAIAGAIDWVGMEHVEMPVMLENHHINNELIMVPADVTTFVNLNDAMTRGIHMSRLYLHLNETLSKQTISPKLIRNLLNQFLHSHEGISNAALIKIAFEYLVKRKALNTDHFGWRKYPISIAGSIIDQQFQLEIECSIMYSSTCPCSAALARHVIQDQFTKDFNVNQPISHEHIHQWLGSEQGIAATPHSQRSEAQVKVKLNSLFGNFAFLDLIDTIENSLKTVVQTAVKREDEQAFAKLNGKNLMYCEDAVRRIKSTLDQNETIADFWIKAKHYESLHPHDAVAIATKGIKNGYQSSY